MSRKLLLVFSAVTILALIFAPGAMAQDDENTEDTPNVFSLIIKGGGFIGILIILLSVVMTALVIEHFVTIRRDKLLPPDLLGELEVLFEDQEYPEAMEVCDAEPSFLTNVIGAALPKISLGYEAMAEAIYGVSEEESVKLQQKIAWLSLIGNTAPMMGLLGTVWGMIQAFQTIAQSTGPPEPKALADKIQLALVTTLLGLVVAIPAMAFYFVFRNKVVRMSMEITAIADELLDRFRTPEG